MGKNVFITGASGFIGNALAEELLSNGFNVTALIKSSTDPFLSHENLNIVKGDILDSEHLISITKGMDIIFHCAAFISFMKKDLKKMYEVNVTGTKNILEAGLKNKIKKIVYLSAASVLGYTKDPKSPIDENIKRSQKKANPYAYTKTLAEDLVKDYTALGLDVSIANICTVYGAGDKKLNSGALIKSIYEEKVKFAPPGGTSYISIKDLVKGLILLSLNGKPGERYIFCGENLTFFDLFNRIACALKKGPVRYVLPQWSFLPAWWTFLLKDYFLGSSGNRVNILTAEIIKESYFYKYYNSKKAGSVLGWAPEDSLEDTVKEACVFYAKKGLINE